jgi:sodium transport system permease protein
VRSVRSATLAAAAVVLRKELVDALRDRRTLLAVLLGSVAIGPLVLVLLSAFVADLERRAERREVFAVGIDQAPTLRNYLERQSFRVVDAPPDYEARLARNRLDDAVLVVGAGFEAALVGGEAPRVEIVGASTSPGAQAGSARIARLLQGFQQEQATLRLAWRGVSPGLVDVLRTDERDLAPPAARASRLAAVVPFFVLMAVLYGALHAALDSTAGERERGSLEPLLATPAPPAGLVLGKWGAAAAVAMLIALLGSMSFLPASWWLRSESLAAMFRFGWREALLFLALLLPLAGALAALLMAIAIRSRSVKEAQASATLVVLGVSLLPLVTLFDQRGEAAWQLWVPALAQVTLMGRVLRGEAAAVWELALPLAASVVLAAVCLTWVARSLRRAV